MMESFTDQHYFRKIYSYDELSDWVTKFATRYMRPDEFSKSAIEIAKKILKEEIDNNSISVCLMISKLSKLLNLKKYWRN